MSYVIYKGEKYYVEDGRLNLCGKKIRDITEIKGLETISDLKILYLTGNQINDVKGLETLKNLENLYLSGNKFAEIKGLKVLTNLKMLYLSTNQINDILKIEGLNSLKNLQKLCLRNNKINEIKGLENLTNLRVLDLSFNIITEIRGLENLSNLEKLKLSGNQIKEIKGLENNNILKDLRLFGNKITEIKNLENLNNLEHIYLHSNPIKNEEYYLIDKSIKNIMKFCQDKKDQIFEFDFAFSFAGEDRDIVRKVKNSLVKKGISVFFDEDFEWDLIGKNLSDRFKDIYSKKSKYVVIFISKHYKIKEWTDFEFQIAREEAESRKAEFILPIRLDDTFLLGVRRDIGYSDYRIKGTRKISNLLKKKLEDFNERQDSF